MFVKEDLKMFVKEDPKMFVKEDLKMFVKEDPNMFVKEDPKMFVKEDLTSSFCWHCSATALFLAANSSFLSSSDLPAGEIHIDTF